MIIETLSTGDEVITGFVTDTNASWLSQKLLDAGIQLARRQTVGDKLDDIVQILNERSKVADIIIVNGGLGPTSDDNTTEAATKAGNVERVLHQNWIEHIKRLSKTKGFPFDVSNEKQAWLPEGAELINNPIGTACGFKMQINKATCYFTPGVPKEFKQMIENHILPDIITYLQTPKTSVKRFFTLGMSESKIGSTLSKLTWPNSVTIGYRAQFPIVEVKLIFTDKQGDDEDKAQKQLLDALGAFIIAQEEFNIPAQISKLSGSIPLQILESGTDGTVISCLATEMYGLTGHYIQLPIDTELLVARIKKEQIRTLMISKENSEGFALVYFNGKSGYMQRIKPKNIKESDRKQIVTVVALDMLRRLLSGQNPFGPYENLTRTEQITFHI